MTTISPAIAPPVFLSVLSSVFSPSSPLFPLPEFVFLPSLDIVTKVSP
jgi:hypothetical protein